MRSQRVLFVAEAMTLAHVVRLVTLANALHADGADVWLAVDPRYSAFIGPLPYTVEPLQSLPAGDFFRALASGARIFDFETLARYAKDELALFTRLHPDLVVGDFRLSLGVSARHAGIPFVNVTNAYWSPRARVRHVVPEYDWVRWFGIRPAQALFTALRRFGYAHHAAPVNRLRGTYGLPSLGSDFGRLLTDGDAVCFADAPQIVSLDHLAPNEHFIGPVPWSPKVRLPDWWPQLLNDSDARPLIYVNLGSSGSPDALQSVLNALQDLPVRVIAATAGRAITSAVPANARVAELLPGDEACALAQAVVCNGGSPATYQALKQGVPVIGIASNMDQFLNMAAVEDAGCGRLLRSRCLTGEQVRAAVRQGLESDPIRESARRIGQELAASSATERFRAALAELSRR